MIHYDFYGDLSLPKDGAKRPFVRDFDKHGRKMKSMSFGIKPDRTNIGFVELFGAQQDIIKVYDVDNQPLDVEWNDRNDPDVIASVRSSNQFIAHLGPDFGEKRFISAYDMIEYLEENLPSFEGNIHVSGNARYDFYNGRTRLVYNIKNVFAMPPEKQKHELNVDLDYFWTGSDVEVNKEDKKIYVNGYTQEYISKDEGQKFVATPFVYIIRDVGEEDGELTRKQNAYFRDKLTNTGKKVMRAPWRCSLKNGSDTIPFDESQLTLDQREAIELGINTIDDFRPRGQILGQRVTELRLEKGMFRGEYSQGPINSEMKISELEDNIYTPPTTESIKDVLPEKKEEPKAKTTSSGYGVDPDTIDDDDLF